jgi:hypothetical protein
MGIPVKEIQQEDTYSISVVLKVTCQQIPWNLIVVSARSPVGVANSWLGFPAGSENNLSNKKIIQPLDKFHSQDHHRLEILRKLALFESIGQNLW